MESPPAWLRQRSIRMYKDIQGHTGLDGELLQGWVIWELHKVIPVRTIV